MNNFKRTAESLISKDFRIEEDVLRDAMNEEIKVNREDSKEAYLRVVATSESLCMRYLGTPDNILICLLATIDGLEKDQLEALGNEYEEHYILQRFLEVYDETHQTNFSKNIQFSGIEKIDFKN